MADVPDKVLAEKLKAKEEELKKRERDVKQREALLREKQEDLDAAKASCDSLMVELHAREAQIADTEKKHGSLKRRGDEMASREVLLADRETAIQQRLQAIALDEQATAKTKSNAAAIMKEEEARLAAIAAKLDSRAAEINAAEQALTQQRNQYHKKMQDDDEAMRRREKAVSEAERRTSTAARTNELRSLETEHLHEQASERLKTVKAEMVELEAKLREARWKEDSLKEMLEAATERKRHLTQWEAAVSSREAKLIVAETQLGEATAALHLHESEVNLRLERLLLAEADLSRRENDLAASVQQFEVQRAQLEERGSNLQALNDQLTLLQAALSERETELHANLEMLESRRRQSAHNEHLVNEKERALKSWLLELEYRQRAIERREARPRPYLDAPLLEPEVVLQTGAAGPRRADAGAVASGFNRGLVTLQVAHLQRAYLGATSSKKPRSATPALSGPNAQSSLASALSFDAMAVASAGDLALAEELSLVASEFRDLTSGFAIMDDDERQRLFTAEEVSEVNRLVEAEAHGFDEHRFLVSMSSTSFPEVSSSVAPRDAAFVAQVQSWAASREAMVEERLRRSSEDRLRVMSATIALLKGRVPAHVDRVAALTTGPRSLSRQTRTPNVVVDLGGSRPSTRQSSRGGKRRVAPTEDDGISWGEERPVSAPPTEQPEPSGALALPATTAHLTAAAGSRASTPAAKAHRRLVDALPAHLRSHYSSTL